MKYKLLARDLITVGIEGVLALLFQFLVPRVPTIYEGDISLSYPVGNTIPHASVFLVMCSFLTVLMIYPILLILMILFCVYKKKPGRTVLASDQCDA